MFSSNFGNRIKTRKVSLNFTGMGIEYWNSVASQIVEEDLWR